ncbi:SDR family NAD(P)-dependent oxidoreductase [Microvenator marinus]|uniref:SDR family NAD(P)-dependent oxidoreductase n=1 Tax=Microvenator marinus TaxID=2600177 RepID=A0A5B8Y296_9DELT|nr:SDR family NAD(P)-dependent oxidoreductase [Microvenator marinus]QED30096.1 SDR family NAD(P)-dependent oxidoreductase [Microvenator marinus]
MGILNGKVALITGAGAGLGRAYAHIFAKEGAKVVVNDLGEDTAQKVVAEIKEAGGEASAFAGSVADHAAANAMVQHAVDTFGKLDIVVNNAGILRDRTLVKLSEEEWDIVLAVHLKGTYLVTKAAVLAMGSNGGRIINTSSLAGLKGNFGQANYGSAKAGIAGFTRVVALETQKAGITVNAIAPVAKTAMTKDISMVPESFEPEDIAPLVCWLASDDAAGVTGRIFGCHGSHYFEYVTELTPGVDLGEKRWTPRDVGARFKEITAKPSQAKPDATGEGSEEVKTLFQALPGTFKADKAGDWAATILFEVGPETYSLVASGGKATIQEGSAGQPTGKVTFNSAETLLEMASGKMAPEQAFMSGKVTTDNMGILMKFSKYFDLMEAASSLGVKTAQVPAGLNKDALGKKYRGSAEFVTGDQIVAYAKATDETNPQYFGQEDGDMIAPPVFPVRPLFKMLTEAISDPELNADLLRLVHGEQDMKFHRHLKPWDLATPRAEISKIESKESGDLVTITQRLFVDGKLTTEVESVIFVRATERKSSGAKAPAEPVAHEVIFSQSQTVAADQPLRYAKASLDMNPIHVDEGIAKSAGHPSVILHGLCTMAFAARALVDGPCDGDPQKLQRLRVRFSKPVLPGWTLTTSIWKESESAGIITYGLEVKNQDGVVVISNASAEVVPT